MDSKTFKLPKQIILITALLLLLSLLGCSPPTEAPTTSAQTEIPPTQLSESPDSDVITIYLYHDPWVASSEQKSAIATLISQFNQEHKDEIVVHQSINRLENGKYYAVRAENFDCFLSQIDPEGAASSGVITNLTNFMAAEDAAFQQEFDQRLLESAQYNHNLYTLPVYTQPAVMAYNADLLAELGLEPPALDWTFDDFIEMITAVASSSSSEQLYGFLPSAHMVNTTEMFYSGRDVQWRDSSGEFPVVMLNTPKMAEAITWMTDIKESGIQYSSTSSSNWYQEEVNTLRSGQIGFWTAVAGLQNWDISHTYFLSYNIGIVPLPQTDIPIPYARSYDTGFYISNQTEHPEACWELAKYFSSAPITGIPARLTEENSAAWEEHIGAENAQIYQTAYNNNNWIGAENPTYNTYFWSPISGWRWQAVQHIENGSDPTQELDLAQQYAEAYLECMAPYDIPSLSEDELYEYAETCEVQVNESVQTAALTSGE